MYDWKWKSLGRLACAWVAVIKTWTLVRWVWVETDKVSCMESLLVLKYNGALAKCFFSCSITLTLHEEMCWPTTHENEATRTNGGTVIGERGQIFKQINLCWATADLHSARIAHLKWFILWYFKSWLMQRLSRRSCAFPPMFQQGPLQTSWLWRLS